jgi:hypothetical protein
MNIGLGQGRTTTIGVAQANINYQKILIIVKKMKVSNERFFKVCGIDFYLLTMDGPTEDDDQWNAFFSQSTLIDGFDIYLNILQEDKQLRRCLFHEIIEALWISKGKQGNEAHQIALIQEIEYFGER